MRNQLLRGKTQYKVAKHYYQKHRQISRFVDGTIAVIVYLELLLIFTFHQIRKAENLALQTVCYEPDLYYEMLNYCNKD